MYLGKAATQSWACLELLHRCVEVGELYQEICDGELANECSHLCRGDLVEAAFQANLVEDKSSAGPSYVDYLCTVHRHIQERNR